MNKMIFVGEVKIGEKGCVHQGDLADALGVERLSSIPKKSDGVTVIVGKLLGGKEPAVLKQAKLLGLTVQTVNDVMNDGVRAKLGGILASKPKLETYEKAALAGLAPAPSEPEPKSVRDHSTLADLFPMPRKGKKKSAA